LGIDSDDKDIIAVSKRCFVTYVTESLLQGLIGSGGPPGPTGPPGRDGKPGSDVSDETI